MNRAILLSILFFIIVLSCENPISERRYDNPFDREGISYTAFSASFSPYNGERDVTPDTDIVITFNRVPDMENNWSVTINSTVYNKDSPETSLNGTELTIDPAADFEMGSTISVDFAGFEDIGGEIYTGTSTFSFTIYYVIPVTDTGQTGDYTAVYGEDSDYVDVPSARSFTGPTQHGTYTNDYTTLDNVTGLTWKTCSEGQTGADCTGGNAITTNWFDGKTKCEALNSVNGGEGYAGRNNWTLPLVIELVSILDFNRTWPTIDTTYFPNTISGSYWTSMGLFGNESYAWCVAFWEFVVHGWQEKASNNYIRCVSR